MSAARHFVNFNSNVKCASISCNAGFIQFCSRRHRYMYNSCLPQFFCWSQAAFQRCTFSSNDSPPPSVAFSAFTITVNEAAAVTATAAASSASALLLASCGLPLLLAPLLGRERRARCGRAACSWPRRCSCCRSCCALVFSMMEGREGSRRFADRVAFVRVPMGSSSSPAARMAHTSRVRRATARSSPRSTARRAFSRTVLADGMRDTGQLVVSLRQARSVLAGACTPRGVAEFSSQAQCAGPADSCLGVCEPHTGTVVLSRWPEMRNSKNLDQPYSRNKLNPEKDTILLLYWYNVPWPWNCTSPAINRTKTTHLLCCLCCLPGKDHTSWQQGVGAPGLGARA